MIDKEKPFLLYCCFVQMSKEDEAALQALPKGAVTEVEQRIKEAVEAAHPVPSAEALVFQPINPATQEHIKMDALCVDAKNEKGVDGLLDLLEDALKERERVERLKSLLRGADPMSSLLNRSTNPYRDF